MQPLEDLQQRISQVFSGLLLAGDPPELYDPISYTLALGGKRLRPLLLLAACDLFDGNLDDAINPAIGIELFHNFTLLHDDLMDDAPLRRGKETVYKKWNANIAILAGDTMFALSNRYMLRTRSEIIPSLLELFNQTAIEVCEGQQYDMNFESRNDVSLAEYMNMIRLKTAVLLACSLKSGAIIAGAGEEDASRLYHFGINVGIAFQLMDDLLDAYSSGDKFGKIVGGDILEAKKTYLILKALELAGPEAKNLETLYQTKHLPHAQKIAEVKGYFDKFCIQEITQQEIIRYWEAAKKTLQLLPVPPDRIKGLMEYCSSLMQREY